MDKSNLIVLASGKSTADQVPFEVVERKGVGHPDTLCDTTAEKLSAAYSQHTLDRYGTILRHMVDKIAISGGGSRVQFGKGEMTRPIRVYLNCRFTTTFQGESIPYLQIATDVVRKHFAEVLPLLDLDNWLVIVDNTHFSPGPGVVYDHNWNTANERRFFFEVPSRDFAYFHNNSLRANDTSTTVSYYPLSTLECAVLRVEQTLNSKAFKEKHPYVGTDIKVMGRRVREHIGITVAVPFIAAYTPSSTFYHERLVELKALITNIVRDVAGQQYEVTVWTNTRDDPHKSDYYLTLTGSAIESGDEGVVGRGNRYNGVIPFNRHMSLEACCGKNPVYHVGKVNTAVGSLISQEIHALTGLESYVFITSQMGRSLTDPWSVYVEVCKDAITADQQQLIEAVVERTLADIPSITQRIVRGDIVLY